MYYYELYEMQIISDFEFTQLTKLSEVDKVRVPQIVIQERMLSAEVKCEQECCYRIEKEQSFISNSYCYLLIENGEKIYYERKQGATTELLSAYILGWGISTLFYQRGQLAIHCSCVAKDTSAVLISGDSGSGKSTITSELLSRGYSFMADDMSIMMSSEDGTTLATAAFPYQKLCRDSVETLGISYDEMIYIDEAKDKFLVPYKGEFEKKPTPVKAMIILALTDKNQVKMQELIGADKLYACMNALFLKPLLGDQLYAPENGMRVLKFASRIPVYRIERPVGRDSKEEVTNTILKILERHG